MIRGTLLFALLLGVSTLTGCSGDPTANVAAVTAKPKTYVGSDSCKGCHLEHFDSWMATLHSRMLVDARKNRDAIIVPLDPDKIVSDLKKIESTLKIPAEQFYIPKPEDVKYTIGSQWKQRYLVERNGELYMAPIQYNAETGRWVNYNEDKWDKVKWINACGGCHATGVDVKAKTFEPSVGCEACHGPGSWHVALPKTAVFDKRQTIVNPAKLTPGISVQICGSCHNRGKSTVDPNMEWPIGYMPGKALTAYFQSTSYAAGDKSHLYPNEFSKAHHQQYIDWVQSKHYVEGISCLSCHYVHQLGVGTTRYQTRETGSKMCMGCHPKANSNLAHSIHSFGNCVGCHMPKVAKNAESGDLHSHVFKPLLPKETLADPKVPNSCQACHRHKDEDLKSLQERFDALAKLPVPVGKVLELPPAVMKGKP